MSRPAPGSPVPEDHPPHRTRRCASTHRSAAQPDRLQGRRTWSRACPPPACGVARRSARPAWCGHAEQDHQRCESEIWPPDSEDSCRSQVPGHRSPVRPCDGKPRVGGQARSGVPSLDLPGRLASRENPVLRTGPHPHRHLSWFGAWSAMPGPLPGIGPPLHEFVCSLRPAEPIGEQFRVGIGAWQ